MKVRSFWKPVLCTFSLAASLGLSSQQPIGAAQDAPSEPVKWQSWTPDIFQRAKAQHKFVLLDLEAIWCHWCHVMDEKTYSRSDVRALLNKNFIAVKVDQDSRPDLSNRYGDYGWPATVFFNPSGKELEIHQGFIPPKEMIATLNSVVAHPNLQKTKIERPSSFSTKGALSPALKKELEKAHADGYDTKDGAWGFQQKFLDWDSVEYAIAKAIEGDKTEELRARETLNQQQKLIDPVWGGVYQYSAQGDWDHPHFEKIMQMQAEDIRVYTLGYLLWKDPAYLKAAQNIHRYLEGFLMSPEGAFYTSQDADLVKGKHSGEYFALDDAGRRKEGIPSIDKHVYARENGWAISALCDLYMATNEKKYLEQAIKAADWIVAHRGTSDGGYRHDEKDAAGPYLGDAASMGRASLMLYTATGDRAWLKRAEQTSDFISKHFAYSPKPGIKAGYATAASASGVESVPLIDENVMVARFGNLLYQYTGRAGDKELYTQGMKYLAAPAVARTRHVLVAGFLLANLEGSTDPAHLVTVGAKTDATAAELHSACLAYPSDYKRIEWIDRSEGPPPRTDVEYPKLAKPATFVCAGETCSAPLYDVASVEKRIKSLTAKK
ncbi:MAG TPA: DUF255 domain-containing protein [Drouetiella sp.]